MIEVETFEHAGCTVYVGLDEDPGFANPREMENATLLFCWHPDYVLGDEQFTSTDRARSGLPQFEAMEDVPDYLRDERGAVGPILPLYLYDHSGVTISVGRNPMTFDAAGWDTTMVGFACCPEERIDACCGDGAEYRTDEWIEGAIREEVRIYDAYLRGQVYWYRVENAEGEVVDSCGGFLVVDESDMEAMREEARFAAEADARDREAHAEPDVELGVFEATR